MHRGSAQCQSTVPVHSAKAGQGRAEQGRAGQGSVVCVTKAIPFLWKLRRMLKSQVTGVDVGVFKIFH